jgi:hypothetical protein
LDSTPDTAEDVIVEANGQWHTEDSKYGSTEWMKERSSFNPPQTTVAPILVSALPQNFSTPPQPPPSSTSIFDVNRDVPTFVSDIHMLHSQEGAADQHDDNLPPMDPTPGPYIPADSHVPACKRLTSLSHPYFPHEVISLIEAVFKSKDEVKKVDHLRGDDAQTFVDVIHEVCLHPLYFRGTV